jgi:hypothetical protein
MELLIVKFLPVTSFNFDPNIFLNTILSDTLNLCLSLSVRD